LVNFTGLASLFCFHSAYITNTLLQAIIKLLISPTSNTLIFNFKRAIFALTSLKGPIVNFLLVLSTVAQRSITNPIGLDEVWMHTLANTIDILNKVILANAQLSRTNSICFTLLAFSLFWPVAALAASIAGLADSLLTDCVIVEEIGRALAPA
jgi:hypothetical protein